MKLTKPFVKLDVHLHSNEKILPLSHAAFRLWITSLTYSKEQRLDGHLGTAQARQLATGQRVQVKAIKELLDSGRWEQNGQGYVVHDFDDWQQVETEITEARAEAGRKGGVESGKQRRSKNEAIASSEGEAKRKQNEPKRSIEPERETETERETDTISSEANASSLSPVVPSPRPRITPARMVMLAYAWSRKEQFGEKAGSWLPTLEREKLVNKWLAKIGNERKGYSLNDLLDAAVGWRRDPFSLGDNDRHTRYCDFELIFRDSKHIEKFRDLERAAHEDETAFADDQEPDWQRFRREKLEAELAKED